MSKTTRVVWGEYAEPALIKDEHGNLYEWHILKLDEDVFGCDYVMGLKKVRGGDGD